MINNLECEEPRITIKKDTESPEIERDVIITFSELPTEIGIRNKETEVPIYVRYEYKYCWNLLLIDSPGLKKPGEEGETQREELIMELAKNPDRTLVFVEDTKDWSEIKVN